MATDLWRREEVILEKGNLWFGNTIDVIKFDGSTFTLFGEVFGIQNDSYNVITSYSIHYTKLYENSPFGISSVEKIIS